MTNVQLLNTSFQEVYFVNCKLVGFPFQNANPFLFEVKFEKCNLRLASFYKQNMKKTTFSESKLEEVDFSETNLMGSIFKECALNGAIFDRTNLEKVDFSTSFGIAFDPEKNQIKKAKFSKENVVGLLQKYNIEMQNSRYEATIAHLEKVNPKLALEFINFMNHEME